MVKRGPSNYDYVNTRRMGFTLKRIHEVWNFEESDGGLFAEYVDTWLKSKTEASGWPSWCETPEQKDSYVRQYKDKEGIDLQNVTKNPDRKQVAKLISETQRRNKSNNPLNCTDCSGSPLTLKNLGSRAGETVERRTRGGENRLSRLRSMSRNPGRPLPSAWTL